MQQSGDDIFSTGSVAASLLVHVAVFGLIALVSGISSCRSVKDDDVKIMDITVVLHENLDKPPDDLKPDDKPKQPDPPKPPPKRPDPPKPPDPPKKDPKVDAVEKIVEKPKTPEKKPEKKPFKKGERIEKKTVKPVQPPKKAEFKRGDRVTGNGPRTEKMLSPAEIKRLLAMGAKEGTRNQVPDNELSLCYSLIKQRFYDNWDQPAWSPNIRRAILTVRFGPGGNVVGYKLTQSSGDAQVDSSIRAAAARVRSVPGLTADFLRTSPVVPIAFEVAAQ